MSDAYYDCYCDCDSKRWDSWIKELRKRDPQKADTIMILYSMVILSIPFAFIVLIIKMIIT